jgi:hypothetical protein
MNEFLSIEAAGRLIDTGAVCCVAGDLQALQQLPKGAWIGGSIPYFMTREGGVVSRDQVFVTVLTGKGAPTLHYLGADDVSRVVADGPEHGYSLMIVPAGSQAHSRFAQDASTSVDALLKPTIGWVSGVHASELNTAQPVVFDGRTGQAHEEGIVVARVHLPEDKLALVEITNIFEGDGADVLRFEQAGFNASQVLVNGERCNFAEYLHARGNADGRLPLVGDFGGASINASVRHVDLASGTVQLYAPVFPDIDYHLARPVADYVGTFRERAAQANTDGMVFSCNCVLNFLYGNFEGQSLGQAPTGPVTFGEIGYQLLNQTLVSLRVV